jgi:hypothetical protein
VARPLVTQRALEARYRRLAISCRDLIEAGDHAARLSELPPNPGRQYDSDHRAHALALVVSYARPFRRSHGRNADPAIAVEELALDERLQDTHNAVMRLRDKVFAHSDADTARVDFEEPGSPRMYPSVQNPLKTFSVEELREFRQLIGVVFDWIVTQMGDSKRQLIALAADPATEV